MRCKTFIKSIDDFVDSELPQPQRLKLEEHLNLCPNCREELQSLQSLMDRSASLSRSVMPDRDLWPQISAGIDAAGPPPADSLHWVSVFESGNESSISRLSPWIWRFAAVMAFGVMLILAESYLQNRAPAPVPNTPVIPNNPVEGRQSLQTPSVTSTQGITQDPRFKRDEANLQQDGSEPANYIRACQCEPSPEILSLIDKAWIVDSNVPWQRTKQVVAERLYKLAGENADDFFLHKASLEARTLPLNMVHFEADVTEAYRTKLAQHPNDPVLTYLYAYTLFGIDTPREIRLMQQLAAEYPEFPWPNLALAEIHGQINYRDENKIRSYLQAFMTLCPKSPEPIRSLLQLENSDFLADAVRRMRANLAARSDPLSLLLYTYLWYLEIPRQATGEAITKLQQAIRNDLTRLRSLGPESRWELAELIRVGYGIIGDRETSRDLAKKDLSSLGRQDALNMEIRDWNAQNPIPQDNAPIERRAAYWESRLQSSDSWIKEMPENPSLWIIKLEALAALKNHPESEFLEVATKALALERENGETQQISPDLSWSSNILKLSSLCADQGVWLDQIPALIKEGLAAADKYSWETASDLVNDLQWNFLRGRFSNWLKADDAWHSLATAYLRKGKPEKAREALDYIESGLTEFRSQLAQKQESARTNDGWLIAVQRQEMADELAAREKRYAAARAGVARAKRK